MAAFLVTGNPGSGKSTLAREVARRGLATIDPDDDPALSYWEDDAGNRVARAEGPAAPDEHGLRAHRWVWNRSRLQDLLAQQHGPVFVCGIALNIDHLLDLFDRLFVLRIDAATQEARLLAHDASHPPGRTEAGRQQIRGGELKDPASCPTTPTRGALDARWTVHHTDTRLMAEPQDERVAGATLKERIVGRGWERFEPIEAAYERGEIDAAEWHRRVGAIIGPAYLAATDPRGQSGSSSGPAEWEQARRFVFAAVHRDGTFLDVGCANGHLLECAVVWLAESGYRIEPYGLEILPELAALARQRLPQWADRIVTGNALQWAPERPFDFVRTGLEYVPAGLQPELVRHLLDVAVAPGGRLIIGAHTELAGSHPQREAAVAGWGFRVAGRIEVPHAQDIRVVRRAFWIEPPG